MGIEVSVVPAWFLVPVSPILWVSILRYSDTFILGIFPPQLSPKMDQFRQFLCRFLPLFTMHNSIMGFKTITSRMGWESGFWLLPLEYHLVINGTFMEMHHGNCTKTWVSEYRSIADTFGKKYRSIVHLNYPVLLEPLVILKKKQ